MKKLILFNFLLSLFFSSLVITGSDAASMTDYCIVPPYVIQDVPPNIMFLVDNSGSMFNFAYACSKATTTASGNNTTSIVVDSVSGFNVGQKITVGGTEVVVTAVNSGTNTLTVSASLSFASGTIVQDWACQDPNFYDMDSSQCNTTTVGTGGSSPNTTIPVTSTTNVWVGQMIVLVHSGTPTTLIVNSVSSSTKKITVSSSVSFSSSDTIYDYTCYYFNNLAPEMSFDPTKTYYGYFNSNYYYTYTGSGGKFLQNRVKPVAKLATEWDGNFLNWLTMRRADVLKRVLTGGYAVGGEGTGFDKVRALKPDDSSRGIYKAVAQADQYMGCTGCTGNMNFTFATGNSNPSSFTAYAGTTGKGSFSVDVVVPSPVEGVIQNVVGAKARIGVTFYNTNDGGKVQVSVAGTSLSSVINQINLTIPSTNTPLAEALWTVTGYFAQQSSMEGGPGPRWNNGDFQINNNNDPWNYATGGGNPRFPACSKSYVLLITDGEPCSDGNLPATLKDYASGKSKFNCSGSTCPAVTNNTAPVVGGENFSFPASTFATCSAGGNVAGIEDVALYMHTKDLRSDISGMQNLTLYTVFAFGKGSTLLKYAAINGGFNDYDGTGLPDKQAKWDTSGTGSPDTYYEAQEGADLEQAMTNALSTMLKRASSGTAASVLASGEGSGANLVQAVFYPRRRFGNDIIAWNGENQNFWYYIDPLFTNSSIREETVADGKLNLINDYIAQFYFDTTAQQTKAKRFQDTSGTGSPLTAMPTVNFENLGSIWQAGVSLWARDLNSTPRIIYTNVGGSLVNFVDTASSTFSSSLASYQCSVTKTICTAVGTSASPCTGGTDTCAVDDQRAKDVIRYIHGYDLTSDGQDFNTVDRDNDTFPDYRYRTVTINDVPHIWKFGDIIDSTPRIASWIALNSYNKMYQDSTYGIPLQDALGEDPPDPTHYVTTAGYKSRGMVFVGGNDGMLHAFKLGHLDLNWSGQGSFDKARLSNADATVPLGQEMWAFIPKNVLPYLKYFADPDYCHVYSVDLTPYIFDASIGQPGSGDVSGNARTVSSWRTILIGGMRLGGACRNLTATCTDCVKTPLDSLGYSSYFALDVTDTLADKTKPPVLLWEFSDPTLGFATSGPAVVRISTTKADGTPDITTNGKWFVILGSGPTGPIDTTNNQFLGHSDQNLKLFVLNLYNGSLARSIDTTIPFAFAGSLLNASIDPDVGSGFGARSIDYSDDAAYVGYVKKASDGTWTDGGVGRIFTNNDPNPGNWQWRKLVDGIGPVTTSITKLQSRDQVIWLYFGTGRYFFEIPDGNGGTSVDDGDNLRRLYGIKEPCYVRGATAKMDPSSSVGFCQSTVTGGLSDVTCASVTGSVAVDNSTCAAVHDTLASNPNTDTSFNGWYIVLDGSTNPLNADPTQNFRAERVITDPLASPSTGVVFFTTYKAYSDVCGIGGKSAIWAVKYNTGGSAGASLKGVALLQVSTGSIEQKDLSSAFTDRGLRKTAAMEGVPPTQQGLAIISTPPPTKRTVHIRER
ncbi:MAG TPA: hypothetical protein VEI96_05420 [Thermodesulfovibrionales bacterium]|nr:hypothetical protein [Thermodesulfovibrionales bacterium]